MIKFSNGLIKILVHETNMKIPIFNSLFPNFEKKINSKKINFNFLNNLDFKRVNKSKFSVIKIIDNLPDKESLYETVLVSANDRLVKHFLEKEIKFDDISKYLLKIIKRKEFHKYKFKVPLNIDEIRFLNKYVSLKIDNMCV
jgi:1-deoxy-D-xylulose-5-phosphate reductoisomerase